MVEGMQQYLVLRSLHEHSNVDKIYEELKKRENVKTVNRNDIEDYCLNAKNKLWEVRHQLGLGVRWGTQKSLNTGQCRKCQKHGLSQGNCYGKPKCARCGEAHMSGECSKQKEAPTS